MTAPKRDNRRFQTGRGMFRQGATYICHCCKRQTRETGQDESSLGLCAYCLLESYLENELSDCVIEQPEFEQKLDALQKQYKRGKYAKTEADAKTRKIQSSRYVAPVQETLDVIATATDAEIAQAAPQAKKSRDDVIEVKVGQGIVEVLQLDDKGVLRELGLEIVKQTKETVTIKATRRSLENFASICSERVSSQYDQPLWYMSSAKATSAKVMKALAGGK